MIDIQILTKLLIALDTAVIEHYPDGSLEIIGAPPDWFRAPFCMIDDDRKLKIDDEFSFLGSFIVDAREFWKIKQEKKVLWSGPWEQTLGSGEDTELEAGALYIDGRNILIVKLIGHSAIADREMIQKAREHVLSFEELFRTEQDLAKYSSFLEEKVQQRTLQVRKTLSGVIQAITKITEMRDPYTAGHQRRVAELACAIALEMKYPKEEIESLQIAGSLHDIGKIYVPAEILNKSGKLSDLEIAIIKTHCQAGYEILKNIDFPQPVAQIILQHHENMDGTGYPNSLSGEDIFYKARILRVADVVEAMISHRPYRPELGEDKTLDEIKQKRGILYDAEVVDACLRLFQKKCFHFHSENKDD